MFQNVIDKILAKMKDLEEAAAKQLGRHQAQIQLMPFTSLLEPIMNMFKPPKDRQSSSDVEGYQSLPVNAHNFDIYKKTLNPNNFKPNH